MHQLGERARGGCRIEPDRPQPGPLGSDDVSMIVIADHRCLGRHTSELAEDRLEEGQGRLPRADAGPIQSMKPLRKKTKLQPKAL